MSYAQARPQHTPTSPLERTLAASGIALLVAMNVALISWKIGPIPLRGMVAGAILGMVFLLYPARVIEAVGRFAPVLWLAAGLALLGTVVSLANGTAIGVIMMAVTEVHVQIAITVLVAAVLADIAGMRASATVIAAVIGGSVLIGMMQFVGIDPAWTLRETLGRFQGENVALNTSILNGRPLGLAFSPIQFSTHACLAFAVYAAAREQGRSIAGQRPDADPAILIALGALCAAAFISGTRSPILGAAAFFLIYALRRRGSWLGIGIVLGGLVLLLIGPLLLEVFQSAQPRILRTDDNSATGRGSLFTMGMLLFTDNPLGYGLAFSPKDHWSKYWQELYTLANPSVLKDTELHNYVLNMINTYGIGLLLAAPIVYYLLQRGRHMIIFFVPYIMHIMFHNSGPFWNDTLFWFAVAALSAPILRDWAAERGSNAGAEDFRFAAR